jgi:hypothetical protein
MSSAPPTCPFCNAELPPLIALPQADKVPCPRCGEPVPGDRFPVGPPPTGAAAAPASLADRKRHTVTVILSLMGAIFIVTLIFALMTTRLRQARHPKVKDPEQAEAAVARRLTPPGTLLALDYLPRGTNLVAGLHTSLLKEPAGAELFKEPRPTVLDRLVNALDQAGLKLDDVDHVALGVRFRDDAPLPLVTTVVVTKEAYPADRVARALAGRGFADAPEFRGRPVYASKKRQGTFAWLAGPRVVVFSAGVAVERPDRFVEPSDANLDRPVRDVLSQRLNKQSRLWAAGELTQARTAVALLPAAERLKAVEQFAVGVLARDKLTLVGEFHTAGPEATQDVRAFLDALDVPGAESKKVEAPPAGVTDANLQWVTWQVRLTADAAREWLESAPIPR